MNRYLLLLLSLGALLCSYSSVAQVQLQPSVASVGLVQKDQLWNIVVVNGSGGEMDGHIKLSLRNRQTGVEELNAVTTLFHIPKGGTALNAQTVAPVQYNYLGIDPGSMLHGMLPGGMYIACYSFFRLTGDKQEFLTEECISFDVEPLSPPLLITPADSSQLDMQPTQFQWIPPAPVQLFAGLTYELLIAEVYPSQKPAEALQENIPFFSKGGLTIPSLSYTGASLPFEKEKWYAWQVIARDNRGYAAVSEAWVFKIITPETLSVPASAAQFQDMRELPGQPLVARLPDNNLYVRFYSYEPGQSATVKIATLDNKEIEIKTVSTRYGENMIHIPIHKRAVPGEMYKAELSTASGKKYSILFIIRNVQ